MSRLEELRKSERDKQFVKQFHRIRMSLFMLREEGLLYLYMDGKEKITQKVNERMFAEEDDELLSKRMNLPQFICYANGLESDVARYIWLAKNRDQIPVEEIAKSCSQPPIWTFDVKWVVRMIKWHDAVRRVEASSRFSSADNHINKLMALAWAIGNN
jgi:hypothetical protein